MRKIFILNKIGRFMRGLLLRQSGFTLVELILGMAIMGVLMAGTFSVLSSSLLTQGSGFAQERVYDEGRNAVNAITKELRYATVGTISGSTITYTRQSSGGLVSGTISLSSQTLNVNGTTYAPNMVQSLAFAQNGSRITCTLQLQSSNAGVTRTMPWTADIMTGTLVSCDKMW
ncbi:MAG: prepilin-type N-terminal cleavage/methylation domain-containing protein [Negativicutes bacterium]|nr:prepilin-type N-terminal cleavage/methylation domain-containing protein [Negativicutes bacterium]